MTPTALDILVALDSPDGRADPYPHYAALLELGEAVRLAPGSVALVGYDAIAAVLRDPRVRHHDFGQLAELLPEWQHHPSVTESEGWILNLDPPEHTRIRSLMSRAFTARRVAALEPAITRIADDLLDAMAERGSGGNAVEFMEDFAYLLPVTVICELIGIPESDRTEFRPLARAVTTIFDFAELSELGAADKATVQLLEYFSGLAAVRRADPRDDLLSALVGVAGTGDGRLTDRELTRNLVLLLVAGFETTTNLLGNGLHIVLHDPVGAAALRSGEVPVTGFIEEVLRYDSPVQAASNRVSPGLEVGGLTIEPGEHMMPLIGAGNRDPRRFSAPERFEPLRAEGSPLSFGGGAHFCIGAALARLEAAVAFPRLLARFPALAPAGKPVRRSSLVLRGYDVLPVTVS
jgi:cytochrome P450